MAVLHEATTGQTQQTQQTHQTQKIQVNPRDVTAPADGISSREATEKQGNTEKLTAPHPSSSEPPPHFRLRRLFHICFPPCPTLFCLPLSSCFAFTTENLIYFNQSSPAMFFPQLHSFFIKNPNEPSQNSCIVREFLANLPHSLVNPHLGLFHSPDYLL